MRKAIISFALGCMCLAMSTGCAAWTDKSKNKDSMWSSMQFWKKPYQKPDKLAAIWTHDILTMTGKPPTRGFGGRLYFYNPKSQAIPVEGELIVHGYEENRIGLQVQTEKTKADKTFMFTAEQFTEHFSPSDLGASYSVWIPWDPADGMQKEITLIPTFKGKDGVILQGEPAKLILPGRKPEDPLAEAAFQAVSFQKSQTPTNVGPLQQLNVPQQSGLRTTTISVPTNSRLGRDGSSASVAPNYNLNNTVQVTESTSGPVKSNIVYAGSPQANRVQAMYAAYANQQATNQQAGNQPAANQVTPPSTSSMPNMLAPQRPGSQYQLQTPGAVQNGMNTMNGMNFGATPQTTNGTATQPSAPMNPGFNAPGMPVMNAPNNQAPTGNATQPQWMIQQPGFASAYTPVQPGAVQAAFASQPGLQGISQLQQAQWQPFAQPAGQSPNANVQPAHYNNVQQSNVQPATNSNSVPAQFQR